MMRKAFNIEWDTDGDEALALELPDEIMIPDDVDEDDVDDYLSDQTGFCVFYYETEESDEDGDTEGNKETAPGVSDWVQFRDSKKAALVVGVCEDYIIVEDKPDHTVKVKPDEVEACDAIYKIPVTWEMCGIITVQARSAEKALNRVEENLDHIKLPYKAEYVDGSFCISDDEIGNLHLYQHE